VPIYYESRLAKLALDETERPRIDVEFEEARKISPPRRNIIGSRRMRVPSGLPLAEITFAAQCRR